VARHTARTHQQIRYAGRVGGIPGCGRRGARLPGVGCTEGGKYTTIDGHPIDGISHKAPQFRHQELLQQQAGLQPVAGGLVRRGRRGCKAAVVTNTHHKNVCFHSRRHLARAKASKQVHHLHILSEDYPTSKARQQLTALSLWAGPWSASRGYCGNGSLSLARPGTGAWLRQTRCRLIGHLYAKSGTSCD